MKCSYLGKQLSLARSAYEGNNVLWYNVYRSSDKTNEYPHLYALHSNDRLPLAIYCKYGNVSPICAEVQWTAAHERESYTFITHHTSFKNYSPTFFLQASVIPRPYAKYPISFAHVTTSWGLEIPCASEK
jgi:hypothetical protein